MGHKYKILKINYNTLDTQGDVYIVYANRATPNPVLDGYYMVSETESRDTELFIYPQHDDLIRPLDAIGRSGSLWDPNMDEFREGGLTLMDNVRHTAYYHETLFNDEDENQSPAIIHYKAEEISFNNRDWIKYDEPQDWDFAIDEIRTPYGTLSVEGYMEVEQNGLVGVQLETYGYIYLSDIPQYPGDDDDVFVKTVAVMRQPNNVWLWLYLFDDHHNPIASICGLEGDVMKNELTEYLLALREAAR